MNSREEIKAGDLISLKTDENSLAVVLNVSSSYSLYILWVKNNSFDFQGIQAINAARYAMPYNPKYFMKVQ